MYRKLVVVSLIVLSLAACGPVTVTQGPNLTGTPPLPPSIEPPTPSAAAPTEVPATPTLPAPTRMQFLAYVYNGQLLVADVTNGVIGGTTQYTMQGQADQVGDLVWSPSGEFVAFVSSAMGDPHVFYIFAEGASTPTDLGPGSAPAWSPDSRSVAYIGGTYPDNNLFVTSIENPAPRQLTFEKNHAWGRPAFAPDGSALIVSTADHFDMGAQGNTTFTMARLALDGSGILTNLPAATPLEGVRLPSDVRVSPNGTRFAFSTSGHVSACASLGSYYVSDFNGTRQELVSQSLRAADDPSKEHYLVGLSYGWMPTSEAIIAAGTVVDCDPNSPTMGKALAGPQLSILHLDGSEGIIIPGIFYNPSADRSGTMIAAAHYQEPGDQNPMVEIYSAQTGQLMVKIGPGSNPQFQP